MTNGYTNHETYLFCNWINNDGPDYSFWHSAVQKIERIAPNCDQVLEGTWTAKEATVIILADQMREHYGVRNPYGGSRYSLWGELMACALGSINWNEVAHTVIDE